MLLFLNVAPVDPLEPPTTCSDDAMLCDVESWSAPSSSIKHSDNSKSNDQGSLCPVKFVLVRLKLGFSG